MGEQRDMETTQATPELPALREPIILAETVLTHYCVLHDQLSLRFKVPVPRQEVSDFLNHLTTLTGERYFLRCQLGSLALLLSIQGVNSRKAAMYLHCWARRDLELAQALFPLVGQLHQQLTLGEQVVVPIPALPMTDASLGALLKAVARKRGQSPEALLQELTAFVRPDKSVYPGQKYLARLSPKQRQIVEDRLRRLNGLAPQRPTPRGAVIAGDRRGQ